MARLRLFAGLRDLAGTDAADVDGDTVGEVLSTASARFGAAFTGALANTRVWVNGDEADPSDAVGPGDEVALIPPVSGGSTAYGVRATRGSGLEALAPAALLVVLAVANMASNGAWWPVAVVGFVTAWVVDVVQTLTLRGREFPLIPTLVAILATVAAVWTMGPVGIAVGMFGSVVFPLGWGVASDGSRMVQVLAPSVLLSFVACAAVGSLVATATATGAVGPGERVVGVYLAVAGTAVVAGQMIDRLQHLPIGDPFTVAALVAIVTSLVAASIWELDLITFLIVGLVLAVTLVAGRGLGSMLRTRQVVLIEPSPGMLAALDGIILAGALFLPILQIAG